MLKRWIKLIVLCFTVMFMHGAALAAVAVHNSFPVKLAVYTNTPAINFQQNLSILIAFDIAEPWHILSSDANNIGLPTKIVWKLPEGYKISNEKWSQEQEFPSEFGPQYGFSGKAFYQAEIIPEDAMPIYVASNQERIHGAGVIAYPKFMEEAEKRRMGISEPELSEDFRTLERRMEGVLGVLAGGQGFCLPLGEGDGV